MKRTVFGLCALIMCFVFSSCDKLGIGGGDPVKKIEDLQEKVENEGDDFTKADWEDFFSEYWDIMEEYLDSDPSEVEYKEMSAASRRLMKAIKKLDYKSRNIAKKVLQDFEKSERHEELQKRINKLERKIKSEKDSSDDDDD